MMFRNTRISSRALGAGILMASLLPILPLGSSGVAAQAVASCPAPAGIIQDTQGALAHVRYLADDALEGRETGTAGARCAADYIAGVFRDLGLQGAGPGGSYFQTFPIQMGSVLGAGNRLQVGGQPLGLEADWIPFGFSADGDVSAPLIYGGPGVSQPGSEDDRYAHLELDGKIVVVEGANPHGAGGPSLSGDPHFKATIAQGRGAAGILVLLEEGATLPDPLTEGRPSLRIPSAAISGETAQRIRAAAQAGTSAELTAAVEPRMVEARNVVALLPGSDPALSREVVIVGAHYDHLGFGGDGSLAPDARAVHNGADDNASGTAAVMEVARRMVRAPEGPSRSVLFIAFTGEEKGLWGSGHYVNDPLIPLENTVAMINMDMVGRLRENTLTVYGTGTAEEWNALLEELNQAQPEPFTVAFIPDGFGPSDQSSFYGAKIPVLHFFTNTHSDYHRPEDDWETINAPGLERVSALVEEVAAELAGSASDPAFALTLVEATEAPHGAMAASDEEMPSPGYGAYMGTIPDMTPQDFGVRITGVREESPAEKAGLQAGDILVELGGKEISDLYAYTYALREHMPGDEVTVVVLRAGERVTLTAVLGSR